MGDHMAVVQEDDEGDEIAVNHDESSKKRSVTTCYDGHEWKIWPILQCLL